MMTIAEAAQQLGKSEYWILQNLNKFEHWKCGGVVMVKIEKAPASPGA